jgi:hypothetical protein
MGSGPSQTDPIHLYKRPDPLDLTISNVINSGLRAQTPYLLVQSDNVVIKQQHLSGAQELV